MAAKKKKKAPVKRKATGGGNKPASKKKKTGAKLLFPLIALVAVFIVSFILKLNIVDTQVPEGTVIDWGDVWSFLTVIEHIRLDFHLPEQDLFFGGIPYVYPPISLISYALLYGILPFDFIFFANEIAPFIGSFAVFGIFYLGYRLTGNPWVGVLAAYISLFDTRYLALSGIPIPEMWGHLQAPIFMYLAYNTAKTKKKNHAILTGMCGATVLLNHHLTAAVLFLTVIFYFIFLTLARQELAHIRSLIIICAVGFILSSPWWFDTINKNIMNLVVSEGESPIPWGRYIDTGGPHVVYLGLISGIIMGLATILFLILNLIMRLGVLSAKKLPEILIEKQQAIILMFAWALIPFVAIRSRQIAPLLFGEIIKKDPNLIFVFSPIYGTRFFDYIAQPFGLASAAVIITGIYTIGKLVSTLIKAKTAKPYITAIIGAILLAPLVYSSMHYGFGKDDPILYDLDKKIHNSSIADEGNLHDWAVYLGMYDKNRKTLDLNLNAKNWALRSLLPDVNASYEYTASLWMRDNIPKDANIVTDYPAGEVVSAGSLRLITTGAELRVTVPLSAIYRDVITMYYTPSDTEAVALMNKWNSTHIYISQRMKNRGWFSIERLSRFPNFTNRGVANAELGKFDTSSCFNRVDMPAEFDGKVWLYECTCC